VRTWVGVPAKVYVGIGFVTKIFDVSSLMQFC
jgi:hypothetical protein